MASPAAAQSNWVRKEVAWWLANRSAGRMLLAWTGGSLAWDSDAEDFDWDRTDALPPELAAAFTSMPRWIDLRTLTPDEVTEATTGAGRSGLRLGDIVAEFAAPIPGMTKDALVGEHLRQRRRTRRLVWRVGTVLALLTVLATAAAGLAWVQRGRAQVQTRVATARGLVAEAESIRDRAPRTALMLGVAANDIRPSSETATGLVDTVASTRLAGLLTAHTGPSTLVAS